MSVIPAIRRFSPVILALFFDTCRDASQHGATLDIQSIDAYSGSLECWRVYFQSHVLDYRGPGSTVLSISGTGIVTGPAGFDPTQLMGFHDPECGRKHHIVFSFSANGTAGVPDGGATVMLLGAALGALGMARRFLKS